MGLLQVARLVVIGNSHLNTRLMHCVQEFLNFLRAHSNPENRVSTEGYAQKKFSQYVLERHESLPETGLGAGRNYV